MHSLQMISNFRTTSELIIQTLPRGLITELFEVDKPATSLVPSNSISNLYWLNQDTKSPFHKLIKRPSLTKADQKKAVITDTSLIKCWKKVLDTNGCLYPYRNVTTGETDFEEIINCSACLGKRQETFRKPRKEI